MSLTSTSCSGEASSKDSLIERILEQGQRLRNAMVQSILDHDPFNTDVINTATARSLVKSRLRKRIPSQYSISNLDLSDIERDKLNAFLKGDSMNRFDEIDTLEALKSMSAEDLCKTTNQVFNSTQECCCGTCLKYNKEDLNCDLKRSKQRLADDKSRNQEDVPKVQFQVEPNKHLKYVDCMRIIVHDLVLNERGNKKVNLNLSSDKKIPVCGSQTFFIEYELPFILSVPTHAKLVKKSLSSSKNNSFVRICARRLSTEAIPFKQTSMHNIKNVDQINLEGIEMKFQISCRTMKQKNVAPLGSAIFNFSRFESSPSLTCIEELPIYFNDNVPIVLGKLRVTLQMGCDRIYFGREFIASFEEKLENTTNLGNQDDQANQKLSEALQSPVLTRKSYKKNSTSDINQNSPKEEQKKIIEHQKFRKEEGNSRKYGDCGLEKQKLLYSNSETVRTHEKQILIGFLYIPEAQYFKANINSFITCRLFGQEDCCQSRLINNSSNPIFNFCQRIPLVYQDNLLEQLRENVMVIEFWEKFETKIILFGLTKLPLHQFYVAYRNPDVTKYLTNNQLPIISSDWWESISNPYTDELLGQVQILLALGTEKQIHNLELERGFKTHTVKANFETSLEIKQVENSKVDDKNIHKFAGKKKDESVIPPKVTDKISFKGGLRISKPLNVDKESITLPRSTEDKGVQSDFEMNSEDLSKDKDVTSTDKLGQLLNQILAMQTQRSDVVEMGTNTDNEGVEQNANNMKNKEKKTKLPSIPDDFSLPTSSARTESFNYENAPPLVRSTSDLLNTLQAALSIPPTKRPLISANRTSIPDNAQKVLSKHIRTSFKAQIFINQALHLPVRKKCKTRKSKGKSGKSDDNVKPSCYVTFETMPGLDLKMTPLVAKSTNPNWNYKCDVFLPSELLCNNQRRLIFKVWRKCTNTTMVPNLQSDLVLGFAAIDLTVLLSGFPNIQGWFNIIDFSSKCNGQINIHITPLEDLSIFKTQKEIFTCSVSPSLTNEDNKNAVEPDNIQNSQQVPQDLENIDEEPDTELLSRALKRKFSELDEITQRLRLRLSHVTNESDDGNDEIADQFERDINSLSIEDDYDMINFQQENVNVNSNDESDLLQISKNSEANCSSSSSLCETDKSLKMVPTQEEVTEEFEHTEKSLSILDRQLLEGKLRIDTLLGKLSLISGEANGFSSRYVSGCSASNRSDIDTEALLHDLDLHSRPNIHASASYDNRMFERIYEVAEKRIGSDSSPSSGTSVISNLGELRAAPDGQGTFMEDKNKVKK